MNGFGIRIPHPGCPRPGTGQEVGMERLDGSRAEGLPDCLEIASDGRVIARRDRMGLGTIRFALSGDNGLLFSDSIPWLAGRLGRVTLDRKSMCEHLTYRYVSGTRTLFREISSVPAGYRVVFTPDGGSGWLTSLERDSAFEWGAQDCPPVTEVCGAFEELFAAGTGRLSEGSRDLFFSGGLDSSLVASFYRETPRAITAGTEERAYDECPRAELAAGEMRLPWSGARMSEGAFLETMRKAVSSSCGTLPVEQIVSYQMLLDRFAPEGPVLAGYGADFLFGEGQRKYWTVLRLSKITGTIFVRFCLDLYGRLGGRQRQQSLTAGVFLHRLTDGDTWTDMMPVLDPPCDPGIARMSLGLDALPDYQEHRRRMLTDEMPPHLTQKVFVTYSNLIADTVSCWSRLLSARGCELRLPFLSGEIIDFVCGLDPRSYLRVLSRKPIISDLAARRLPQGILRLPKMSGTLPVWRWIASPGGGFDGVLESLERRNILDPGPLRDSMRASERYGYIPLWAAVNLELILEELEKTGILVEGP